MPIVIISYMGFCTAHKCNQKKSMRVHKRQGTLIAADRAQLMCEKRGVVATLGTVEVTWCSSPCVEIFEHYVGI
jgi:hypothetical protein